MAGETIRLGPGDKLLVRFPNLPSFEDEEIDIDHELCAPVARFMAAILSKEQAETHIAAANRRILNYNAKVYDTLDTLCKDPDDCGLMEDGIYVEDPLWG
jgi:protein involved in polysaccharide export with SLBB domain